MNRQDLKVGEYYCAYNSNIFIWGLHDATYYLGNSCTEFKKKDGNFCSAERLATPEEKHWLDKCIELNKFITKEEAMKSFIPEYVKCTNVLTLNDSNSWTLNKIYKTVPKESVDFPIKLMIINNNGEKLNVNKWNTDINYYFSFKPSTKEEFEAQNKPVETMQKVTTTIDKLTYTGNIDIPKGTTFEVIEEFENSYQVLKPTGYDIQGKYLFLHKSYFEPKEPEKELLVNSGLSQYEACKTCKYHDNCYISPLISSKGACPASGGQHYAKEQEPTRKVTVKLNSRVYSLDEITKVINTNYEKEDALEIIKTIKSIK